MCAKWTACEEKLQFWHVSNCLWKIQWNSIRDDCFICLHVLYLIHIFIFYLWQFPPRSLFIDLISFADTAFREYLSFDRVILLRVPLALQIFTHHVFAWRFEFLLICKQKCLACFNYPRFLMYFAEFYIILYLQRIDRRYLHPPNIYATDITRRRWVTSRNMG